MEINDIYIHETRLPYKIRAMVMAEGHSGDYVICVNDYLSDEAKLKAIEHEMRHIKEEHLYSEECAVNIEKFMK